MPIKADTVIIGGGVMGCAIAYNMAKAGLKPVVYIGALHVLIAECSFRSRTKSRRTWGCCKSGPIVLQHVETANLATSPLGRYKTGVRSVVPR